MPKVLFNPPAQANQTVADPFTPFGAPKRVYKCRVNGCEKTYTQLTDRSRHWWRHIPNELLPTCPFVGEFGYTCDYRYHGRKDLMKKHWAKEHAHRAPYPSYHYFPSLQFICDRNNIILRSPKSNEPNVDIADTTSLDQNTIPFESMRNNLHWSIKGHVFGIKLPKDVSPSVAGSPFSSGASSAPTDTATDISSWDIKEEGVWMDNSPFDQYALSGQPEMSVTQQVDYSQLFASELFKPDSGYESGFDFSFGSQIGGSWDVPSYEGFPAGFSPSQAPSEPEL